MNDRLREFVETGSPQAFGDIVRAHADAVYSQSLRQLGNTELAEEVTQSVFVALAKKAPGLPERVVLAGWLFNATRYCCRNIRRAEIRRRKQEQKAMLMREENVQARDEDSNGFSEAQPLLNDAIAHLSSADRDAILLRYFQGQSLREVGMAMGISEDAAKQRVFRAVEKLRTWFVRCGLVAPSAICIQWLESAVKPAPGHLIRTIAGSKLPVRQLHRWGGLGAAATAAAAMAAVVAIGGALALIAHADGGANSGTAPIQPAVPAIEQPATQPAAPMSQATPLDTMRKLSAAIRRNDRATIDACLTDDGVDAETAALIRAGLHMNSAFTRLTAACNTTFGSQMHFQNLGFEIFPSLHGGFEALIDTSLDADQGAPPTKDLAPDIKSIRLDVPQNVKDTNAPLDPAAAKWSRATLVFKLVNGDWKLDTDRSIKMLTRIDMKNHNANPIATERQLTDSIADVIGDVEKQVEAGQFDTASDVSAAVQKGAIAAFRKLEINQSNIAAVPVIGG